MKKTCLILLLLLSPGSLFANPVSQPVDPRESCWEAIVGTVGHYTVGDGKEDGVEVLWLGGDIEEGVPPAAIFHKELQFGEVRCELYGEYCPTFPPEGVNPHNYPDVGTCTGCEDEFGNPEPISVSVNGAKCCLAWGKSFPPEGQTNC